MARMARVLLAGVLVGATMFFAYAPADASGSAGPGMKSVRSGGVYSLGKSLLFRELVCRRKCPIERRGFNRDRARTLKASLDAAFAEDKPGTVDDEHIRVLFTGTEVENAAKVAAVRVYLERRYRL